MTERWECGCDVHEEVHYELPDAPVEYIILFACPKHAHHEGTGGESND